MKQAWDDILYQRARKCSKSEKGLSKSQRKLLKRLPPAIVNHNPLNKAGNHDSTESPSDRRPQGKQVTLQWRSLETSPASSDQGNVTSNKSSPTKSQPLRRSEKVATSLPGHQDTHTETNQEDQTNPGGGTCGQRAGLSSSEAIRSGRPKPEELFQIEGDPKDLTATHHTVFWPGSSSC